MIKMGFCYLCCQISRYIHYILIVWLYDSIPVWYGRITRPRFHFNGMFGYKDAIDLPFMLLHILHLLSLFFFGFLFFPFSLSLVLSEAEKFLHQTYKCQVQPIWWADISHWYFIIVLNLHIIFPFFMIYTINISFILSFVFHILMVFTIFISSFYFRFAAFRLFITCTHRWQKKSLRNM